MSNKMFLRIALLLAFLLTISCAKENPDLVNPPPQVESVKVRFLNLASDFEQRTLWFDDSYSIPNLEFGLVSEAIQPLYDSAFMSINKGAVREIRQSRRTKFIRNTVYTFAALPSPIGSPEYWAIDTLIMLYTSSGLPAETMNSYLKVFNAFNDSTVSFSVTLGCPSGSPIASGLTYRSVSSQREVWSGLQPVSLIRNKGSEQEILGLFGLQLQASMQYALIIRPNQIGEPELWLLDEKNAEKVALTFAPTIPERRSYLRAVNFSQNTIDVFKMPDDLVFSRINSNYISHYMQVSACESQALDSIAIFANNQITSAVSTSLDVEKRYTVFTFDDETSNAALSILSHPLNLYESVEDKAVIRVIHAAHKRTGLTLSIGARQDTSSKGYKSGEVFAAEMLYGSISQPYLIHIADRSALIPITLFTSTQPAYLLFSGRVQLHPNRNYIFVVYNAANGEERIAVIEENDESLDVAHIENASFLQVINLLPVNNPITLGVEGLFSEAYLQFTTILATVVPAAPTFLSANGHGFDFTANRLQRNLVVVAGELNTPDFFHILQNPMPVTRNYYRRRFVNACKEIPFISVRLDSEEGPTIIERLEYGQASPNYNELNERKISLVFIDSNADTLMYRVNDLQLIMGKGYSIVFGGHSSIGYSAVIAQEF